LDAFKERIKKRAQEKIQEAIEEERLERLGPGGLDPAEVSTLSKHKVRLIDY
jgi:cell division cycle protein 37